MTMIVDDKNDGVMKADICLYILEIFIDEVDIRDAT